MAEKYDCVSCRKQVTATKNNRYRSHSGGDGEPCEMSSEPIPEHVLAQPVGADDAPDVPREGIDFAVCPQCDRKVKLTRMGYFEPHPTTLMGADRCLTSGVRAKHARKTETVPLPGDEPKGPGAAIPAVKDSARPVANRGLALTAAPGAPTTDAGEDAPKTTDADSLTQPSEPSAEAPPATAGSSSPGSATTSKDSSGGPSASSTSSDAEVADADAGPPLFSLAPLLGDGTVLQPFSHILQPFPVPPRVTVKDMSPEGKAVADRLREIFYAYTNRNSSDNRSAQRTLGPSEIGSPCDRQIAMKLLGIDPVNPQEGWAPFVGTAVHEELARMFEWANGSGSGRFVTEMPLTFGTTLVPRGTGDLLDRTLCMFMDHKLMGRYSLKKLIQEGPSPTYRVQVQTYGLGAEMSGEKVKYVAIIGWPRQESTLDNLYVHVEPYDRKIAQAALDRVARIAQELEAKTGPGTPRDPIQVARQFEVEKDCSWCPFHLRGDKAMERGCPGK